MSLLGLDTAYLILHVIPDYLFVMYYLACRSGDFEVLQPLVWLVDDRFLEVQMSAVEILARCIESGANSGAAIKAPQPEEPTEKEAANSIDYMASGDQEIDETEEEEVNVDWREGYEVAILRLLPLMADANDTMRRQVVQALYSEAE